MTSVKFQFVLADEVSSRTIAWFSQGKYSHVDYLMDSGELLGSRNDRVGHQPAGVEIRPAGYVPWVRKTVIEHPCTPEQKASLETFLKAQIGKPYDSTAIWGFAFGRDWRADDSWYCSELQTAALEIAGIFPTLDLTPNKITPVALALALSARFGKVVSDWRYYT